MLKRNFVSIIIFLLNVILLSVLCFFLYELLSKPIIESTTDAYLRRDIQSWKFSNFIKFLTLIYLLQVIIARLFFNNKNHSFKLIVKVTLGVLSVWFLASLYRTFNIFILLRDQMLYVFYIPLLIGSILLPFSEVFILKIIDNKKTDQKN